MRTQRHIIGGQRDSSAARGLRLRLALLVASFAVPLSGSAQQAVQGTAGHDLDRVVAIVNGDPILSSDVLREANIESCRMNPATCHGFAETDQSTLQAQVLQRLIDRQLILQQMKQYPTPADNKPSSRTHATADTARAPGTESALCDRPADWDSSLQTYGVTAQSLHEFCNLQASQLGFIEQRFRSSVRISQDDIAAYYRDSFVPAYRKTSATPPPLSAIEANVSTVLTEREISLLLDDWLRVLRAQSQIVIVPPMKVSP